jgi:hypothetical protein
VTKNVTEVITIAHTVMVPQEILGFSVVGMSPNLSWLLRLLHLQELPVSFHWFLQLFLRRQLILQLMFLRQMEKLSPQNLNEKMPVIPRKFL